MQFTLLDAMDEWLPRNKQLKTFHVAELTLPYLNRFYCIECSECFTNMGWILGDGISTRNGTMCATDPRFFDKIKSYLLKHQRKCSAQK